tara:strand:+ start:97 stop:252 length:156 start_codon:yes stop_codon:yes gene_type:complete
MAFKMKYNKTNSPFKFFGIFGGGAPEEKTPPPMPKQDHSIVDFLKNANKNI